MRIRVKVRPAARKERLLETASGVLEIDVKEPAQGNAANDRVRALIAGHLRVPVKSVRFVTGMRGKNKTFDVVK